MAFNVYGFVFLTGYLISVFVPSISRVIEFVLWTFVHKILTLTACLVLILYVFVHDFTLFVIFIKYYLKCLWGLNFSNLHCSLCFQMFLLQKFWLSLSATIVPLTSESKYWLTTQCSLDYLSTRTTQLFQWLPVTVEITLIHYIGIHHGMLLVIPETLWFVPRQRRQKDLRMKGGRGEELLNSKNLIVYGAQINWVYFKGLKLKFYLCDSMFLSIIVFKIRLLSDVQLHLYIFQHH